VSRHFTPRIAERKRHDYEYVRCDECGHTYYDPIDDYLGQAVMESGVTFPDTLTALYALTPTDVPLLNLMAKTRQLDRESVESFVWEDLT